MKQNTNHTSKSLVQYSQNKICPEMLSTSYHLVKHLDNLRRPHVAIDEKHS